MRSRKYNVFNSVSALRVSRGSFLKCIYEYGNENVSFGAESRQTERPNALKLQIHSENQIRLPSICVDNNRRTRKRFFKCDCQQNML